MFKALTDWPFPQGTEDKQILHWGGCGIIAHAIDKVVVLYVEREGRYVAIQMWVPFDAAVSEIQWHGSYNTIETPRPLLLLCSVKGHVMLYDVQYREEVYSEVLEDDYVTCARWSPCKNNFLYVGTNKGKVTMYLTEGVLEKKMVHKVDFSVDMIDVDGVTGDRIVFASKDGSIAVVDDLCENSIFNTSHNELTITSCRLHPAHHDFLVVTSGHEVLLYSCEEKIFVQFLSFSGIRDVFFAFRGVAAFITISNDTVSTWDKEEDEWKIRQDIILSSNARQKHPDIVCYSFLNDSLLVVTRRGWLTTLKVIRGKIYVTNMTRILDSQPLGWDKCGKKTAFVMTSGHLLLANHEKIQFIEREAYKSQSIGVHVPRESTRKRRNSDEENRRSEILSNYVNNVKPRYNEDNGHITRKETELDYSAEQTTIVQGLKIGEMPIENVQWVSSSRLIIWSSTNQGSLLLSVNTRTSTVKSILHRGIREVNLPITSVFFNNNKKIMCVIHDGVMISLWTTSDNPTLIGSLVFKNRMIGTFNPLNNELILLDDNCHSYVIGGLENKNTSLALKSSCRATLPRGKITALYHTGDRLILGNSNGFVYYSGEEIIEITKLKNAVSHILKFDHYSMLFIDTKGKATIVSLDLIIKLGIRIEKARFLSPGVIFARNSQKNFISILSQTTTKKDPRRRDFLASWRKTKHVTDSSPYKTFKLCTNSGTPFISHLLRSFFTPEKKLFQTQILRDIIMNIDELRRPAIKLSLIMGDIDTACRLLQETPADHPQKGENMLKTCLAGANKESPYLILGIKELLHNSFEDAIDVILLTGAWPDAVRAYFERGRVRDAIYLLRTHNETTEKEFAFQYLMSKGYEALALMMKMDIGRYNDIVLCLVNSREIKQGRVLSTILQNMKLAIKQE